MYLNLLVFCENSSHVHCVAVDATKAFCTPVYALFCSLKVFQVYLLKKLVYWYRHSQIAVLWKNSVLGERFSFLRRISQDYVLSPYIFALYVVKTPKKLELWANAQRDGRPAEYR